MKTAFLFLLLSTMTSQVFAYEVQGVHDSYSCTIQTGYKNYTFSCCDPWVACTLDGSGKCSVLINGITYSGNEGGVREIRSRLVLFNETPPTCGSYTPIETIQPDSRNN